MSPHATPFGPMRRAYARRLIIATLCTIVASGCASALFAGLVAAEHWIEILMLICGTGAAALVLGADLTQRWWQLRHLRIVEDASKPYGFTGTVPRQSAANDFGGPTRH